MSELKKNTDNMAACKGFCPQCGSDLYFAKDGCYCKASFKSNSECNWICESCTPRVSVSK